MILIPVSVFPSGEYIIHPMYYIADKGTVVHRHLYAISTAPAVHLKYGERFYTVYMKHLHAHRHKAHASSR